MTWTPYRFRQPRGCRPREDSPHSAVPVRAGRDTGAPVHQLASGASTSWPRSWRRELVRTTTRRPPIRGLGSRSDRAGACERTVRSCNDGASAPRSVNQPATISCCAELRRRIQTTHPRNEPSGERSKARSGRAVPCGAVSIVRTGPTTKPAGSSSELRRTIWSGRALLPNVSEPHTTHARSSPAASRATAIDADQSPVFVPLSNWPSATAPCVMRFQTLARSLQASWTPLA